MSTIILKQVSKAYHVYRNAQDRFLELLTQKPRHQESVALHPLDLSIDAGEVVGVVGVNGAGKSTLLKLIAGTLRPSSGTVQLQGHVCALLELGSGFHHEMSGRDNIFLGGAIAGLSTARIETVLEEIIDFSGLREAIDRPVKTYSSGMVMRLAFSVATAIDPDILILDETLSVGDGTFAKKSFERIMGFKQAGKTILFCSHSMYQVQAICSRALWLDRGQLKMDGDPSEVLGAYSDHIATLVETAAPASAARQAGALDPGQGTGAYRLLDIEVGADGVRSNRLSVTSRRSSVSITVSFMSDPREPAPSVGVIIIGASGRPVTSASSLMDGIIPQRGGDGRGSLKLEFPHFALLKGSYWVNVFLLCDQGLHVYDKARMVAELVVKQDTLEQGVVSLPHVWRSSIDRFSVTPDGTEATHPRVA